MLSFFLWIVILIVSIFILIKSSDYFTYSAEKIGKSLGFPDFITGITIVAIGTSLPELVSSIFAVLKGSSEIVIGNVVGSNITNIFFVLGVVSLVNRRINLVYELPVDLLLLVSSAFLLGLTTRDGVFTLVEALFCLGGFVIYLFYSLSLGKKYERSNFKGKMFKKKSKEKLNWKTLAVLIICAVFIYGGAEYTIEAVVRLSELLNKGKEIIALSVVAMGTSLPELMVVFSAMKKRKTEIAIGNILGSNIFNTFAVMGISGLIGTLIIPHNIIIFSLPLMLIATLLYFFIIKDKKITRWEGILFLLFYLVFIGKIFNSF